MRIALLILTWLGSYALAAQEAAPPPSAAEIAQLVKQLDAEKFAEREAARDALAKIGAPAKAAVEAALKDEKSSAELKLRAAEVLKKIELDDLRSSTLAIADIVEQAKLANRGKLDQAKLELMLQKIALVWSDVSDAPRAVPVTFKEVAAAGIAGPERLTSQRNALIMLKTGNIISAQKCIILAETAVDVSSARDCIIIAGVSASVTSPRNCIVISGYDLYASSGDSNLLLCGGEMTGSIVRKAVVGAPQGITFSTGESVIYLNSPEPMIAAGAAAAVAVGDDRPERVPKRAKSDGISLEMPKLENDLAEQITLTFTMTTTAKDPFVLFRRKGGDGEYVARAGQELKFPDGKPIPELAGWRLLYCGRRGYAVFEKGDNQSMVKAPK